MSEFYASVSVNHIARTAHHTTSGIGKLSSFHCSVSADMPRETSVVESEPWWRTGGNTYRESVRFLGYTHERGHDNFFSAAAINNELSQTEHWGVMEFD